MGNPFAPSTPGGNGGNLEQAGQGTSGSQVGQPPASGGPAGGNGSGGGPGPGGSPGGSGSNGSQGFSIDGHSKFAKIINNGTISGPTE